MMTIMLMVPNPQKIRMALNAHRDEGEFPFQETLVVSLDEPQQAPELSEIKLEEEEPESRIASRRLLRMAQRASSSKLESSNSKTSQPESSQPESSKPEFPGPEASPLRVASADPTASIGYQPPPTARKRAPQPMPESAPEPAIEPKSVVMAQPVPPTEAETEIKPFDILVPEPHDPKPVMTAALPETKLEPSESPSPAPSVLEPLARVKEPAIATVAPSIPSPAESFVTPSEPAPAVEMSNDPSMSITTGLSPKRWNFRFRDTQIESVFKTLGQYQGYTVVVEDGLSGTYTGQFLEADPAQAFAVLVKSRNCRVSRRGNIILLTRRDPGAIR